MKKLLSFVAAAGVAAAGSYAMTGTAGAIDGSTVGLAGSGSAGIVAPLNTQQELVHFECAAAATIAAASTSVDACDLYADGAYVGSAQDVSLSGQAAATAATAAVNRLTATLNVCWTVSTDPILGDRITRSGCSTIRTGVLAA
jgi:hypothetical protein